MLYLITCFIGCKKEKAQDLNSVKGNRELYQVSGGMTPLSAYTSGNGNIIKFTDSTYFIYRDRQVVKSGKYRIVEDFTVQQRVCLAIPEGQFTKRIIYDSISYYFNPFMNIADGKLTLIVGCFATDAGSLTGYKRKANHNF